MDSATRNEVSLLREYKGYHLVDAGAVENGDPGDCKLEIQTTTNELHDVKHTIYFNNVQPENLNKAIERAKEWVNAIPNDIPKKEAGSDLPRFSDEELQEFMAIVDKKLEAARKELDYLDDLIKKKEDPDQQPGEGAGSGQELEQLSQMRKRQETFVVHLEAALSRIEDKTYGVCRVTGKLIDKARLRAVPHATLSIEAKNQTAPKPEALPEKKSSGKKKTKSLGSITNSEKTDSGGDQSVDNNGEKTLETNPKVRTCRVCGCTQDNCQQCIEKTGSACHWVEDDLCSACVPEPEIEVKDERASVQEAIISEFIPQPANFFQQLQAFGKVDLTLRVMQVGDKLQVGIFPAGKATQVPINMTGTAEELDNNFFSDISAVKDVPGYVTNIEQVKKAAAEKKDKPVSTPRRSSQKKKKPAPVSKPKTKKSPVKAAVKKSAKPLVKKEKEPVAQATLELPEQAAAPASSTEENNQPITETQTSE